MECLVAPLRVADAVLVAAYDGLFRSEELMAAGIHLDILREAARLRATFPGVRTPDAIHTATARMHNCVMFLTNDAGFRRIPGLPVVLLDDVVKS
ncbi:MAG TPA: PIN domain-containing protein [Tepidisphaeraceae bacterium]|nr:PIN domain-containing protein [Tepidisphaeraceae bacterium]